MPEDSKREIPEGHKISDQKKIHVGRPGLAHWLRRRCIKLWKSPFGKLFIVLLLLTAAVGTIYAMPKWRFQAFNIIGMKTKAEVVIRDDRTKQPIKGAIVSIAGKKEESDRRGRAKFRAMQFGDTELKIEIEGYQNQGKDVVLGYNDNNFGEIYLVPTGKQLELTVVDWLSQKPIAAADVGYNQQGITTDEAGRAIVTVERNSEQPLVDIVVKKNGYIANKFSINQSSEKTQIVTLVPDSWHFFISQREGKYNTYRSRFDGSEQSVVLAATGKEGSGTMSSTAPNGKDTVVISTRNGERDKGGNLLTSIYLVTNDGSNKKIDQASYISPIGWSGDTFVYSSRVDKKDNDGDSYISTVNTKTSSKDELSSSPQYGSIQLVKDRIFFTLFETSGASFTGLRSMSTAGVDPKNHLAATIYNLNLTSVNQLVFSSQKKDEQALDWWQLNTDSSNQTQLEGEPAGLQDLVIRYSRDLSKAAWVEERDGKNVIVVRSLSGASESKIIATADSISSDINWIGNDTIVYYDNSPGQSSDFVISTEGGESHKISDVTRPQLFN
jgi:hypothetical protein